MPPLLIEEKFDMYFVPSLLLTSSLILPFSHQLPLERGAEEHVVLHYRLSSLKLMRAAVWEHHVIFIHALKQCFLTLGPQMFFDCNSQKPSPLAVLARISGNCSPRTSGGPSLGTTAIKYTQKYHCLMNSMGFVISSGPGIKSRG